MEHKWRLMLVRLKDVHLQCTECGLSLWFDLADWEVIQEQQSFDDLPNTKNFYKDFSEQTHSCKSK